MKPLCIFYYSHLVISSFYKYYIIETWMQVNITQSSGFGMPNPDAGEYRQEAGSSLAFGHGIEYCRNHKGFDLRMNAIWVA